MSSNSNNNKKLFVHFIATTTNCDRQRIYSVANCLGDVFDEINTYIEYKRYTPQIRVALNEEKIAVFQRVAFTDNSVVNKFKDAGYKVVIDMDDDPRYFDIHRQTNFTTYPMVDAVIVSTNYLANFIRQYNPNTFVFENHLSYIPSYKPKPDKEQLRLFFGAFNREGEYEEIMPVLNKLINKHNIYVEVVNDNNFYTKLETLNKNYTPHVAYPVYLSLLGSCHFALLPLKNSEFNKCKSDLKFLECGATGAVAIASPTVYGNSILHGKTGIIYNSPDELETNLEKLINEPDYRNAVAFCAYQHIALTRQMRRNIYHYRNILEHICTLKQD